MTRVDRYGKTKNNFLSLYCPSPCPLPRGERVYGEVILRPFLRRPAFSVAIATCVEMRIVGRQVMDDVIPHGLF